MYKNLKKSEVVKIIKRTFQKNSIISIILVIIITGIIIFSLLRPQALRFIIDEYLSKERGSLIYPALLYFGTIFGISVFNFSKEIIITILGEKIIKNIKCEMMSKLNKIPTQYLTSHESGSLVSLFTNDVLWVGDLFTKGIASMIIDCFKIIGIIISITIFSYKLAIIVILSVPIVYFITINFKSKMLLSQTKYAKIRGRINNFIPETINNMEMIKSLSKEEYMKKNYEKELDYGYTVMDKINFYDSIFSPTVLIIRSIVVGVVVILCSDKISYLGISIGSVAACIELINNIFAPIENLAMEMQSIQQAMAGIYRIDEFLDEEEDTKKNEEFTYEKIISGNLQIKIRDLSFAYEENINVVEEIDFNINHRQNITFVGRTGCGKTTLFKLLLGVLKPTSGSITLSDMNIDNIPNNQKRKIFGYVEQSFSFIEGDIIEQITLRDENINFEKVEEVMKIVGLHDYVLSLENQYNTVASEEIFSKGQCQLLSIARALVTSPPIMLLDEITANLDVKTEEKIINVLKDISKDRTLLSISHRLSSFLSDEILIIENKKLVKKQNIV